MDMISENPALKAAIWQSEAYILYPDSVVQPPFSAVALSPTEIVSDYQSPANEFQSPRLTFKFSINGKDNEMPSGQDHHFACIAGGGTCETPLIRFGEQLTDTTSIPPDTYLAPNTTFNVRLDMRPVLDAFEKQGYYTAFNGDKIYKEDFKGVFIAGNTDPLTWDFDNLANHQELELKDPDGDGIYEAALVLNANKEDKLTATHWQLSKDISAFPQYTSDYVITDALYNMALEEMINAVEPDSTFRTGKEWAGVWTRDISYSIILSMAMLQPKVAKYSLMRKVENGRIIQDTGTGGAYPVSTDRIVWAIAAWELYKVTGDADWLKKSYQIIKNSLGDDLKNVYDFRTGLVRGESSFLDWREQTYPEWMQPADIYESENLGTNAVHYQANIILAEMAEMLHDKEAATRHLQIAENIKKGVNEHLWIPEKGYYGQYLYGRNFKILSPRAEALGEALSVLFGVADAAKQKTIVASTPVTSFGIPNIYPQIPNIPPYHNNAVWPFVQSYWSLAAAKVGNEQALVESMSAIYRPAALFLTNKENFVASNGDYAGTQINSSNMLWSLSGNLSMIYKVLFGMDFRANSLVFRPFVPEAFKGERKLTNFRYRKAILDIAMTGYGNEVKSITMDDKAVAKAEIPGNLEGSHTIKIELANKELEEGKVNQVEVLFSPEAPSGVTYTAGALSWKIVEGAARYKVLKNGVELLTTTDTKAVVPASDDYVEYQVIAIDAGGLASFANEPVVVATDEAIQVYELEKISGKSPLPYKGYSGNGFVEISKEKNTSLSMKVTVPEAGVYAIDFRYANGAGPINTSNKCAIRTLKTDNTFAGTIVLPQRGTDEWSDWGYTNSVQVKLDKGTHTITLSFEPANENMNGEVNKAMLDYVRITKL
ncbi:glycogen debranching protein [Pontibacter sp. 172403-2]|uniref:alpha-L-rhamnosidase-related protein n=1 Tax=Pontibacter rufus TaxID=2791028 RepID=UPI0018AF748F|nr:glycogen debranching protein [Pontibacter sp. 172403-2]MBF9255115.1 glycogen debranching protein [Pontibacter sp. 172403-2]